MADRILLVEDDDAIGRQVIRLLVDTGFEVEWMRDGDEASLADPARYALAILDLMLPGAYGLDVLKRLRAQSDLPVLILSARREAHEKVRALELGADDFMTKPFWPEELVARVRSKLRRPAMQRDGVLRVGRLTIDTDIRAVTADGRPVDLTRVEFDLLLALARRPGATIERAWFRDNVLDAERDATDRAVDAHVSRLRKKLGDCAGHVATVWGLGYRLDIGGGA